MFKQPNWKFLANLGDTNPIEHGGYFIFEDTTGVYPPEGELWHPERNKAYRFMLEQMSVVEGKLISKRMVEKVMKSVLHHPLQKYVEWFDKELGLVARANGAHLVDIQGLLCSEGIIPRAAGYRLIYEFHGWENADSYPLMFTEDKARERYKEYING